jgi:hypothetical protein
MRQRCSVCPLGFNSFGIPRQRSKTGRRNKKNLNRKKRSQTRGLCKWHNLIPKRTENLHQISSGHHKYLQQSSRIQNQYTKTRSFFIYQE